MSVKRIQEPDIIAKYSLLLLWVNTGLSADYHSFLHSESTFLVTKTALSPPHPKIIHLTYEYRFCSLNESSRFGVGYYLESIKMPLLSLPPEIILIIARYLSSPKELFDFLQSNRKLHSLLIHDLYQNDVKSDGGSALVWYARHGYEIGVGNMLAAGANVNIRGQNRQQSTALMEAVIHKHPNAVQTLLENGALPDAKSFRSKRALLIATAGNSEVAITELLLKYGAQANLTKGDKTAPLLGAIKSNQEAKVALLLKYGADTGTSNGGNEMHLLHVAAARNATPAILKMLIDAGIPVDSQDSRGRTPLQMAAACSSTRAVRRLLDLGANVSLESMGRGTEGWTALFFAAKPRRSRVDNITIIRTLIMHGAEIDCKNEAQQTPLQFAISQRATKQAQALVDSGASILARNADGETVLHLASLAGFRHHDLTYWLTQSGADVNWAGGKQGETPIFYAIRDFYYPQNLEKIQDLLSLGADVHFQNVHGLTPLSLAASLCSLEMTKLLLDHGSSVNSRDIQGRCPLHHVCETNRGNPQEVHDIVALLIQHGADVSSRDYSGRSPLHGVAAKDWTLRPIWQAAGELLEAGADRYAMTNDGKSPLDMVPDGICSETQGIFIRLQHANGHSSLDGYKTNT